MSTGELAAMRLRELILQGALAPNTRIPQDDLADSLGISQTPLREALIALQLEGWVTLVRYKGAFVNAFDEATLSDHYELIGLAFGFAARTAVKRTGLCLVADLRRIQTQLCGTSDPAEAGRLLRKFNYEILVGARSPRVGVVLRAMPGLIPGDIFTMIPQIVDVERSMVDDIVVAFSTGDGDLADRAFRSTIKAFGVYVTEVFRDRRLLQDRSWG